MYLKHFSPNETHKPVITAKAPFYILYVDSVRWNSSMITQKTPREHFWSTFWSCFFIQWELRHLLTFSLQLSLFWNTKLHVGCLSNIGTLIVCQWWKAISLLNSYYHVECFSLKHFSPVGLMDVKLIGFQSWMFWAPIPQVRALKVWALCVLPKLFILQGETGSLGFSPNCKTLCQEWDLWPNCISAFPTCFHVGVF